MDAKRGDIGTTAARQAVALFDALGADAITVNPYLGGEAVAPLLERLDRFAYVLCRTSNPGAGELQSLVVAGRGGRCARQEPLYARVARRVAAWGPGGTVGLVVGATAPAELARDPGDRAGAGVPRSGRRRAGRRDRAGASRRAGDERDPAGGRPGGGLLVNVSRGIAAAAADGVAIRARRWPRPPASGLPASLCYPSRRERHPPRGRLDAHPSERFSSDTMPFNIGARS